MSKKVAVIPKSLSERILQKAAESYPEECCGVLIGNLHESKRQISYLYETENIHNENRTRRFMIGPDDFIKAEKFARERNSEIVGFYHSHPDHKAVPSEHDRDYAWPWYLYVIVSVMNGKPESMLGWNLRDDRSAFDEIQINIS